MWGGRKWAVCSHRCGPSPEADVFLSGESRASQGRLRLRDGLGTGSDRLGHAPQSHWATGRASLQGEAAYKILQEANEQ